MTKKLFVCLLISCAAWAQEARRVVKSGAIDSPGNYILTQNISGELEITSNDVTLNLNGYGVMGPGGKLGTGIAIRGVRGVKVSGGSISNFAFGVIVENSANVMLEDLRIRAQGLTIVALPPETGIMIVQSVNVVVRNNAIHNVGLGIFVRGGRSGGNLIANNTVTAGTNGVLGICYNPTETDANGPRGDLVTGNLVSRFDKSINLSDLSKANVIKGNTLLYVSEAITFMDQSNLEMDNVKQKLP
ncbi:MAG: right-handed parallel beta-helix repeat-containing protein [Acidobacteriota bacterium]